MVDETVEILAEMQGKDVGELLKERTETTPEELRETAYDYLDDLLLNDYDSYDNQYDRNDDALIDGATFKQREYSIWHFVNFYEENERDYMSQKAVEGWIKTALGNGYATSTMETRYWQFISFVKECNEFNKTVEREARDARHKKFLKSDEEEDETAQGEGARPIKREEHQKMMETVNNRRLELMLMTEWQTGLRAKELVHLELDDLRLDERKVDIDTVKEGEDRVLSINLKLKNELRKWKNTERHKYAHASEGYVFPTKQSAKMYPRNFIQRVREIADEAGIQDYNEFHQDEVQRAEITVHSYRKSFGLRRLRGDSNSSTRRVQMLLGHSDVSTTENYLPLDEEDLEYTPDSV
jgi:integrase